MTSYDELFQEWEQGAWGATGIDFALDAEHWTERLSDLQRDSALWYYAMFLVGVETIERTLPWALGAAAGRPEAPMLAAQVADEARQRVFLDRFLREVAGQGHDRASTQDAVRDRLTWGFRQLFGELERVGEGLRDDPSRRPLLAQYVAICHVVIEGVLAIPGHHFIQGYVERERILPGLATGLKHIDNDVQRHVALGIRLLNDLNDQSRDCRQATVQALDRSLPWMVGVFIPPGRDSSYVEGFGFTLTDIYSYGLRTIESKLQELGIDPEEMSLLARDNRSLSYDERARRLWVLIDAGVLGDDEREPEPTQEALEILFEATARATDVDVARSVGGSIQWEFTDAEPWHLVVTDSEVEAKMGRVENPALRLEVSSPEWAKIAVGRGDPRWALLTRKLRVHGPLAAKRKLPNLFG
jgi:ribonucleoside-diphosphate reductase beta chain